MGLIKAAIGTAKGILGDQWKEMYYCDSLGADTLMVKGKKRTGKNSSNTRGSDDIITKGSIIVVADGQCAIVVDQGEILEVVSEPGEFVFDDSTEPTLFCGNMSQGLKDSWEKYKKRFTFGGDTAHDQRVYYFNTKEILGSKFGTPNPIPFRAVDANIGLDLDTSLRCSGTYSFRVSDPILLYKSIAGNVKEEFTAAEVAPMMKAEFVQALQPAIGRLSELGLRPSMLPSHTYELTSYINDELAEKWKEERGIEVMTIVLNPVVLPEEDQEIIKNLQKAGAMRDPNMAAANIASAQADAMRTAAGNQAGAMNGFIGMGMAQNAGLNAVNLFAMGQNAADSGQASFAQTNQPQAAMLQNSEVKENQTGAKFCSNCGSPLSQGAKFCSNCGSKIQ